MKALALLHDEGSAPGLVGEALIERGWEVEIAQVVPAARFDDPGVHFDFPDATLYDLLVPFGAPWSVYDTELIGSWVQPEIAWLRDAVTAGVPVLGVCFGGQVLAAALGGHVSRGRVDEVGWHHVDSDRPDVVPPGEWFQWHGDRFSIPPGATSIARNGVTEQAFVHGRSLGLQFHPELDPAILDSWLGLGGEAKARALGLDPEALVDATAERVAESGTRTRALVNGYLDRVHGPTDA